MTDLPHLLMAGTTGSGKSTCLHAVILSVLMRATPEQARMLLIDTRGLELGMYDRVRHLVGPVATSQERGADALARAAKEAQTRIDDFAAAKKRTIEDYNAAVRAGKVKAPLGDDRVPRPYPLLLVAIDDLADLLRSPRRREIEESLLQIGTRGRTAGIHVVAGTRHPQARALPPLISASMPARLSFAATETDGPTRHLRVGTAQLRIPGEPMTAVWCPEASVKEIAAVVEHWRG